MMSEVKCVTGFGGPPPTGCSQTLTALFTRLRKATAWPSGVQCTSPPLVSGTGKTLAGRPPAKGTIANAAGRLGSGKYQQAIHMPSGEIDGKKEVELGHAHTGPPPIGNFHKNSFISSP